MKQINLTHTVLTLVCEVRTGIVHAISGARMQAQGNITESHQFTSGDTGRIFMRLQIESPCDQAEFEANLAPAT